MADYRKHFEAIRAADANLVAISVDPPEKAESVRRELRLPFLVLGDTERRVVCDWDIFNAREKGGIAKPALFLIDRGRLIRFMSLDSVATRTPASEVVRLLKSAAAAPSLRRKTYIPTPRNFFLAVRQTLRRPPRRPA